MKRAVSYILGITLLLAAASVLYHENRQNLTPVMNVQRISVPNPTFYRLDLEDLRIAVLSDLHVAELEQAYAAMESLIDDVIAAKPDMVVLLGDYTQHPSDVADMESHRSRVIEILARLTDLPAFAVLGNYETWSELHNWRSQLKAAGVSVLHNEVLETWVADRAICLRGLGDAFTDQFEFTSFPRACRTLPKITMTHDPAAAFKPGVEGFLLAGHTHCGQVALPRLTPLWVPSSAPAYATCGLYEDNERLLWVSAGIGTSILPIRLGVPAQWDLLTVGGLPCSEGCPGLIGTWQQNELCRIQLESLPDHN